MRGLLFILICLSISTECAFAHVRALEMVSGGPCCCAEETAATEEEQGGCDSCESEEQPESCDCVHLQIHGVVPPVLMPHLEPMDEGQLETEVLSLFSTGFSPPTPPPKISA